MGNRDLIRFFEGKAFYLKTSEKFEFVFCPNTLTLIRKQKGYGEGIVTGTDFVEVIRFGSEGDISDRNGKLIGEIGVYGNPISDAEFQKHLKDAVGMILSVSAENVEADENNVNEDNKTNERK